MPKRLVCRCYSKLVHYWKWPRIRTSIYPIAVWRYREYLNGFSSMWCMFLQVIAGQWLFGSLTCDMFNANDVLFSTASLLHLCCISWDRYIAVTDPFNYERRMTRTRAALTLASVWTASACLSHIPIHLGLYTTASQRNKLAADSNECSFKVCWSARYLCDSVL